MASHLRFWYVKMANTMRSTLRRLVKHEIVRIRPLLAPALEPACCLRFVVRKINLLGLVQTNLLVTPFQLACDVSQLMHPAPHLLAESMHLKSPTMINAKLTPGSILPTHILPNRYCFFQAQVVYFCEGVFLLLCFLNHTLETGMRLT